MKSESEITEGKHVFHVKDGRLAFLNVERVVKLGRKPRYEMRDTWDGALFEFVTAEQHEWFKKSIFLDVAEAVREQDSQIDAELTKMTNEMLQNKEQLANYLFKMWTVMETMSFGFADPRSEKLKRRRTELFMRRFDEFFGVELSVPLWFQQSD